MNQDVVHIATAINRGYLPYFAVMLQSIKRHRDASRRYCVHVLSSDIEQSDLEQMLLTDDELVTVDLLDVTWFKNETEGLEFGEFFSVECIYRLALLKLIPNVDKIIYLDSDLIVLDDISILFDTELGCNYVAAVRDIGIAGMVGGYAPDEAERLKSIGIEDLDGYFSSGVMVWNLSKTRQDFTLSQLIQWIDKNKPRYSDQDCLNYFFAGSVCYLDPKWNTLFDSENIRVSQIVPYASKALQEEYLRARENPSIFHYAGPVKPWAEDVDGSPLFWEEARPSALYESVLRRYVNSENKKFFQLVWETFDDVYFRLSEAERIREDLHKRLSEVEQSIQTLQDRIERLEQQKTPIATRLYNKIGLRGK